MIESNIVYCDNIEMVEIRFMPIKSGQYKLYILANGELVGNSPYMKLFKAGKEGSLLFGRKNKLFLYNSILVFFT